MKTSNKHSKKQQRSALTALVLTAVLLVGAIAVTNYRSGPSRSEHPSRKLSDDSNEDVQAKYNELVKHITPTNVCPIFHPVHILREVDGEKFVIATGGKIVGEDAILTCGHAFWTLPGDGKMPSRFYYQMLEPYEKSFHPISSIRAIDKVSAGATNVSRDGLLCIPGPSELIAPLLPPAEIKNTSMNLIFDNVVRFEKPETVRSTVTGKEVRVIGTVRVLDGPSYFVLDDNTFKTQSGTIYAATDNKRFFTLSMSMRPVPKLRRELKLDKSQVGLSLCTSINIVR